MTEGRNNWRWIGAGEGIHWPDLDEDISVENLILGQASGESQDLFRRWLEKRGAAKMAECGFAITSIQQPDCRTSMNTMFLSVKSRPFWSGLYKTYVAGMILESLSAKPKKADT